MQSFGRIDQVVDVEWVKNDVPENPKATNANLVETIEFPKTVAPDVKAITTGETAKLDIYVGDFKIPANCYGSIDMGYILDLSAYRTNNQQTSDTDLRRDLHLSNSSYAYVENQYGEKFPAGNIAPGNYGLHIEVEVENTSDDYDTLYARLICNGATINVYDSTKSPLYEDQLFKVWIKNIWLSEKDPLESKEEYVKRVWEPILGTHLGDEAAICFSSGELSVSQDYEFKILGPTVDVGIRYDTSKSIDGVTSHWCITCIRSDADFDTLGVYTPNTNRQGNAGDYFYFVGIELTQYYVEWAEQRLHNYKRDELEKVKDINPTWIVSLDKVRIGQAHSNEAMALIDQLQVGSTLHLADERFIKDVAYEDLYLQAITYKFNDNSNAANLTPNVEVTLGTEYAVSASPVATLQGSIDSINRQLGAVSTSALQQLIRAVGDKIYLRKDGFTDRSYSPTYFADLIASLGFREGMVGGQGWAFFKDANGKWVLETDKINVREEMQVNTLVINQIDARGGMIIESAASMEITYVDSSALGFYKVYFDTKGGSVANLFKTGDIAYCHRWKPDNQELKYYKSVVGSIGEDYITLRRLPSVYVGSGVPEVGDVIVQYGNISDKSRQFVIERDVINGGYERMLSNLNSVTAKGTEYFFAGYQSSNAQGDRRGERFFVGDKDSGNYIEYKDGKLTIPGQLILGPNGDDTMIDYLEDLINQSKSESERYADALKDELQDQIDGVIETWFANGVPTLNNYPANEWKDSSTKNNHLGDLYYDNETGNAYRFSRSESGVYSWVIIEDSAVVKALADAARAQDTADHKRRVFTDTPYTPYDEGDLWVNANYTGGPLYLNEILRCKTSRQSGAFQITDWERASDYTNDNTANKALNEIAGFEYIKEALGDNGKTELSKGLVLTNLIQLGVWSSSTQLDVWAGINGLYETYGSKGIAAWYGGDMLDSQNPPDAPLLENARFAQSLFRFDGSGYLSGGKISWNADGSGYLADGNIWWSSNGTLHLNSGITIDGGGENAKTLQSIVNTLTTFTNNFIPVDKNGKDLTWDQVISGTNPIFAIRSEVGFYSNEFISAYGFNANSSSGGGGSSTLSGLTDTTITNPQNAQYLVYNNGKWVNSTPVNTIESNSNALASSSAIYNAILNRAEGVIEFNQLQAYLKENASEMVKSSSPHIFQLQSGNKAWGLLLAIGNGTSMTIGLTVITHLKLQNNNFVTAGSDYVPSIYVNKYTFTTDYMSEWKEIGDNSDSIFLKGLEHANPPSTTNRAQTYMPYIDESTTEAEPKLMSIIGLQNLLQCGSLSTGSLDYLQNLALASVSNFNTPRLVYWQGYCLGYARAFNVNNIYTLMIETTRTISESGTISSSDSNSLNTYVSRYTNSVWSNWKLLNSTPLS